MEMRCGLQKIYDLSQEPFAIRHFMNDVERQCEIHLFTRQSDVICLALMKGNSVQDSFFRGKVPRYFQHLLL